VSRPQYTSLFASDIDEPVRGGGSGGTRYFYRSGLKVGCLRAGATEPNFDGLGQEAGWMPWSWCNLKRNPFGELAAEERAELAVVDVTGILARVRQSYHAVQLIGPCGRGKTTRLLALLHREPAASYVYLAEDEPCGAIAVGKPVMIDEAQRLPRRLRGIVFASGLPLVLATHRDLSKPLRRAGYEVHTEQIGQTNDASTVHRIMNRRIEAARLDKGPLPHLSLDQAERLVDQFGSNIRSMEAYLYDVVQQQRRAAWKTQAEAKGNEDGELRFEH